MDPIYLDYNGTTPVDPAVVEAMLPYLREHFGNPSSQSVFGRRARAGLEQARQQVADLIGAQPDEIYFTSGATEANNWVVLGLHTHTVTSTIEHPSILKACARLGDKVQLVGVDSHGILDPESLCERSMKLLSVMHSNNEIGTIQNLPALGEMARRAGALFHSDAAQSLGKVDVSVASLGVDLLTIAGHKLYAPKGIGALYVRRGVNLPAYIVGAGQERGARSGTENVAYAVALGAACALAQGRWQQDGARMADLRDQLQARLQQDLGDRVRLNGHPQQRLPNTLSVNFVGVTGAELLGQCPHLAASTGPACHDGVVRLSHVLAALGLEPEIGRGAVRLTLGRHTTANEIEQTAAMLVAAYQGLATGPGLQR
ncbi:cysteine desulfurase [bacterium]|nr:cysteine desulfurase [bacterium]